MWWFHNLTYKWTFLWQEKSYKPTCYVFYKPTCMLCIFKSVAPHYTRAEAVLCNYGIRWVVPVQYPKFISNYNLKLMVLNKKIFRSCFLLQYLFSWIDIHRHDYFTTMILIFLKILHKFVDTKSNIHKNIISFYPAGLNYMKVQPDQRNFSLSFCHLCINKNIEISDATELSYRKQKWNQRSKVKVI